MKIIYRCCFRDNSHGQIGSECAEAVVAKPVESFSHVVSIACGSHHSLAIQGKNGVRSLFSCGSHHSLATEVRSLFRFPSSCCL